MAQLEGRLAWGRFAAAQTTALAITGSSLLASLWSIYHGELVAAGFAALCGTASLLCALVWLASVVTWFRLDGDQLACSRLALRGRRVPLTDVVAVEVSQRSGATICLRDGASLYLAFGYLAGAEELAAELKSSLPPPADLEGRLVGNAVATTLIGQALLCCLLLVVFVGGWMCMGAFFHPMKIAGGWVFLALGVLLQLLAAVGFYCAVPRYWLGCVRWFRLEPAVLHYRTVFSWHVQQRLIDDVQVLRAHRPVSRQAESGSWRQVVFRDGQRIKLHLGTLQNAARLYEALSRALMRRAADGISMLPPVNSDHPLWPQLEAHLQPDEVVWWIGRPVCRKLWSEIAAGMLLGLLLAAVGGGMLTMMLWLAFAKPAWGALFGALIGSCFLAFGLSGLATPWRVQRLLRDTVYAVTSKRALVLHGVHWSGGISAAESPVQSYLPAELRESESTGGRDIILGGQWHRGRKGRQYWSNNGFLAPDDLASAAAAVQQLRRASGA